MIEVRKLNADTQSLLWTVDGRRLDGERVVIRLRPGGFALDYKPLPEALWQNGEDARNTARTSWLDANDAGAYLAWLENQLAGQILLETGDNGLAIVRDIRVEPTMRRRGVGETMLSLGEDWARSKGLSGVCVETRDRNAGACQFLTRCGYELGGVDALRYAARSEMTLKAAALRECALFFYKFFR